MEFGDSEREWKGTKNVSTRPKKNTKWGFLARSNVNKYYFKRALALRSICGGRLKKALFNLCAAMIHLCLKEGEA